MVRSDLPTGSALYALQIYVCSRQAMYARCGWSGSALQDPMYQANLRRMQRASAIRREHRVYDVQRDARSWSIIRVRMSEKSDDDTLVRLKYAILLILFPSHTFVRSLKVVVQCTVGNIRATAQLTDLGVSGVYVKKDILEHVAMCLWSSFTDVKDQTSFLQQLL